jgi:hypothetical protein
MRQELDKSPAVATTKLRSSVVFLKSPQKSFISQQSLHWLPRPETRKLLCKARELSIIFVH